MLRNNILMRIAAVILGIAIFSNVGYGSIDYVTCRADDYTQEYQEEYTEEYPEEYDTQYDDYFWNTYADPQSTFVTTDHSVTINGKKVKYTATVGKMPMYDALGTYNIYFNAFTKKEVDDVSDRPITFVFNGGPGAASLWLNIGGLGPQRIDVDEKGNVKNLPSTVKDNPYSILDLTDLVFIDPVGTGFSYVVGETDPLGFYTYNSDCYSVSDFIRKYISLYERWSSPKYLAGESYGTARAVGVCEYLQSTFGIALNGIMLISSANDYGVLDNTVSDLYYVNYLPSYAASAWYHKKLNKTYQNMKLETFLEKVNEFASGEYLTALYKGNRISSKEKKKIAKKMSKFTGLSQSYILKHDLRVVMEDFCEELLSDSGQVIGRFDSRYTGINTGESVAYLGGDPSSLGITEAFISAYNDYISSKLEYKTDETYYDCSYETGAYWSFGLDNCYLAQEDNIKYIMSANPRMKIWVICGYYDLATPYSASEWVFSHIPLANSIKKNLSLTHYESGHMFYMNESSLKQFHKDAKKWFEQ